MSMRGLTILVATGDADRFHAALTFAAAAAAGGDKVRIHLHEGAVALVRSPMEAPMDASRLSAGIPPLNALLDECLALEVAISLCQSGLAMAAMDMADLDDRFEAAGPVAVLAETGEDRLLVF